MEPRETVGDKAGLIGWTGGLQIGTANRGTGPGGDGTAGRDVRLADEVWRLSVYHQVRGALRPSDMTSVDRSGAMSVVRNENTSGG